MRDNRRNKQGADRPAVCWRYPRKGRKWHGLYLTSSMQEVVPDIGQAIWSVFTRNVVVIMIDYTYLRH